VNNDQYFGLLAEKSLILSDLRKEGLLLAEQVIGKTLFKEDLFFCASINRCLNLMEGVEFLLEERNLTCAGAILRLQIDNCLRTYAAFIAEDKNKIIECIINGEKINKYKDINGNKMTDAYLKEKLTELDSFVKKIYNNSSGYIHLSEKAFFETVTNCEGNIIEFQIGRPLPEKRNEVLIELMDAFIHFINLHYRMIKAVAESKLHYDSETTS